MPRIDVTRVLRSPAFSEAFTVIRSQVTGEDHGRPVVQQTTMAVKGVVNPTTPHTDFTGQAMRARRAIRVHTQVRLYDSVKGYLPDVIQWEGNNFVVREANPWNKYGNGFYDVYAEISDTATAP